MNRLSFLTIAQTDGAQTFDLKTNNSFSHHQLQIEVSAQPSVGTMAIAIKTPGASVFTVIDSAIDLTALTATNGKIIDIEASVEAIKITPTGLDAGKTFNAYLVSK